MTGPEVAAIVAPVGVVIGWLVKHLQNGRRTGHEEKVETLLGEIRDHVSALPMLKQQLEQHEEATSRARDLVIELAADMRQRQRQQRDR